MFDELTAFSILLAGFFLLVIGYGWMVLRGFSIHFAWGLLLILLPPTALLFIVWHLRKLGWPVTLLLVGTVVVATPLVDAQIRSRMPIDLGPRCKIVADEVHLTLTGWDRRDYHKVLSQYPQTVVLQMANADVTDSTLVLLYPLKRLRKLDVSDSGVTDFGLNILAALPELRDLRLARTSITDEGFEAHLMKMDKLEKLDVTGTTISSKLKRQWKKGRPERRLLD